METKAPSRTKVLIVDDHHLVAQGLQLLLAAEPDMQVVGLTTAGEEAVDLAATLQPDVLLVDYRLQDSSGPHVARAVAACVPDVHTLFLSMSVNPIFLLEAVRSGARGYVLKSQAANDLVDAVRRVAAGEMLIPASVLADLLRNEHEGRQPLGHLTAREQELLEMLVEGIDNKTIAARLGISYVTVRGHLRSVLAKLNAHSRLEAVARAVELGLVER